LDSTRGTVRIQGHKGAPTPGLARTLRNLTLAARSYNLNKPDTAPRLEVLCPRGTYPVGGGRIQNPDVGPGGEGVYPHSYERLGAQLGFHISAVVLDPGGGHTTMREVRVQALCGRGVIPATPTPHKTVWIRSGQTKTVTAHCPKGQLLVSGGFQRTNFRADGGNYITESRADGPRAWTVTGSAYSAYGPPGQGELTAIAYCARMKNPLLSEVVSPPVPVGDHGSATATTPECPAGKRLITGGFSANGSRDGFFYDGRFNQNGAWSASEYGFFGPIAGLTAYGYCWPASQGLSSRRDGERRSSRRRCASRCSSAGRCRPPVRRCPSAVPRRRPGRGRCLRTPSPNCRRRARPKPSGRPSRAGWRASRRRAACS